MSDQLQQAFDEYLQVEQVLENTENQVEAALEKLKTVAGSPTFVIAEQYYQIRKRSERLYLCKLVGPPKGRPKLPNPPPPDTPST